MVDIAFVNAATYNSAGSALAVVAKPVDIAENDIMFALIQRGYLTEPNSIPEGWTLLGYYNPANYFGLYYKVAGASEPDTYTFGWASGSYKLKVTIAAYRGGFDINDPIDVVSNTPYEVSNAIIRAASMNVSAAESNLIFMGTLWRSLSTTYTKPGEQDNDWVEDYDNWNTLPDFAQTFCHCNWSGSGASGVIDGIASADIAEKHAFAVALNVEGVPPVVENTMMIQQIEG